jgi:nitrogen fixation protein FixH
MLKRETEPAELSPASEEHRRAAIIWPGIIIGLLAVQILLMLVMAYVATSDRTFAVEPDYYQKALNWNQLAAQDRLNQQLGWSAHINVGDAADLMKRRDVTCSLTSDTGQPLRDAEVELIAFPHARGGERLKLTLSEQQPGKYTALLPMKRTGLWEFRITATRQSAKFTRVIQQQIQPAGAGPRWRR